MTLIVSVLCQGGVVLAADGAATLGPPGTAGTARQPVRKLSIIDGSVVIGTSGYVGLAQRLSDEMRLVWQEKLISGKSPGNVMALLRTRFFEKHIGPELHAAGVASRVIGNTAQSSALSSTVLALPISQKPELLQFDQQGAPEMATKDVPFVAIGSGQAIADPFLAFLRRVLWRHRGNAADPLPPLGDGITGALWTLQHAIATNPGGVSDPIQMVILRRDRRGKVAARELTDPELGEHRQAINELESTIGEEWARLREKPEGGDVSPVPRPSEGS